MKKGHRGTIATQLGLSAEVPRINKPTRRASDNSIVDEYTKINGPGAYHNGHQLIYNHKDNSIEINVYTVDDQRYVRSAKCLIDATNGGVIRGSVNCFALGWYPMDQGYADELVEELSAAAPTIPQTQK